MWNRTRGIAALLAASCVAYEWWTLKVQESAPDAPNDTWSQITRDITRVDTLVGKAVLEHGLRLATDWFISHLQEGSSSSVHSVLHGEVG